jgi:hypothetical protein
MTTYIDTKIVCLTSQSANIKYNDTFLSNMRYNLGTIFKNDNETIHRQVQILSAQIPYSFYVVNYTNNTIVFKGNEDPSFTTATIPVGNYNANSLITTLVNIFDIDFAMTVTITLSSINGTITITRPTGEFTLSSDSTCLEILGFQKSTTYVSDSSVLTSPHPLNLLGIKNLQVRCGNLLMNNISSVQGGQTTLLCSIPVSAVPFGMIDYTDKGNLITVYNADLDDLDIEIIDGETGQYINFNNQDWCITLAFHTTRLLEGLNRTTFKDLRSDGSLLLPKLTLPENLIETKPEKKPEEKQIPELSKDLEELNILTS